MVVCSPSLGMFYYSEGALDHDNTSERSTGLRKVPEPQSSVKVQISGTSSILLGQLFTRLRHPVAIDMTI